MIPSCRDVTRLVASGEIETVGFWRRIGVRLHWLICAYCRRYRRQIAAIGHGARRLFAAPDDATRLASLEQSILDRAGIGSA